MAKNLTIKLIIAAVWVVTQAHCTALFSESHACQTTADCLAKRPDLDLVCSQRLCVTNPVPVDLQAEQWGCTQLPGRVADIAITHNLALILSDVNEGKRIAGAKVRLCSGLDVGCQFDPSDALTSKMTDSEGLVSFDVPDGFTGFVLYEKEGFVPGIQMFDDVNVELIKRLPGYALGKASDIALLASLAGGSTYDPSQGLIDLYVENCLRQPAANVRGVLDRLGPQTVEYYYAGALPSATVSASDSGGHGGFLNVPPGLLTISVRMLGETENLGRITVITRAGHVSTSFFFPGWRPDVEVD